MRTVLSLVCTLLCIAMALPPPAPGPRENSQWNQESTNSEQQETYTEISPTQPRTPALDLGKSPEASRTESNRSNQPSQPTTPDWIVKLTFVIAGAAVLQVLVVAIHAWLMRRTWQATQQAADAATQGANTAQQALVTTERAYLTVDNWTLCTSSPGVVAKGTADIINSGRSIAYLVGTRLNYIHATEIPLTPMYDLPARPSPAILIPNAHYPLSFELDPLHAPAHLPEHLPPGHPRPRESFLWIWGYITYADIFGAEHRTGFAVRYEIQRRRFSVPAAPGYIYASNSRRGIKPSKHRALRIVFS